MSFEPMRVKGKPHFGAGLALLLIASCGSGNGPSDAGGGGMGGSDDVGGSGGAAGSGGGGGAMRTAGTTGSAGAGGAAGSGGSGGGVVCGSVRCTATQVCVHPTCTGSVAVCVPLGDGGQCPTGWVRTDQCSSGSGPGCVPPVCDPPPPMCVDVSARNGTATRNCLPTNTCQLPNGQFGGACANSGAGQVTCLSAAAG